MPSTSSAPFQPLGGEDTDPLKDIFTPFWSGPIRGGTFKEIADVLGHQSLVTTEIFAKLDLGSLSQVAMQKHWVTLCVRKKNCSKTSSSSWSSTKLLARFERRQQSSGRVRQHLDEDRPERPAV